MADIRPGVVTGEAYEALIEEQNGVASSPL